MTTLVVSGGTVVAEAGTRRADVVIDGGRIAALTEPGRGEVAAGGTESGHHDRLDATGCFVLPGGVDPHCHVMADPRSATRAAALGGTTTVLSFTNPGPGEDAVACFSRRQDELAALGTAVDVGLHAVLAVPDRASAEDLGTLRKAGVSGVKVFLAYPELGIMWSTRGLFELMAVAAGIGQVVQVHCEEGGVIAALVQAADAAGRRGARVFADSRPPEAEASAVARVLQIAALTGATCYLTHLSSAGAIDQVRLARERGTPDLRAEACLHHLVLDDRCYERDDADRYLVAPPLRPAGHQEALWAALADGTLDTVGSDHAQVRSEVHPEHWGGSYGIAGIGARLPGLLSHGLALGIPIERLVLTAATNPARAFGHYPRKGVLAPGSDADLVLWDPQGTTVVGVDTFDDGTGDSVYADQRFAGRVRDVLLRGQALVRDGRYVGPDAAGSYLRRKGKP